MPTPPDQWLRKTEKGLFCLPGDFVIDPLLPAARALVTHGHADHARPGNSSVLATPETLAIIKTRYRDEAGSLQPARYGENLNVGGVSVRFIPAGHILGSAQIVLEYEGARVIVSGDYKRRKDPTCQGFEVQPCDVFITEATFGLPVFHHPNADTEVGKIIEALRLNPESCVLVGAYALGKCQRIICLLRGSGYDETIYLHGALVALCDLYQELGIVLGPLATVGTVAKDELRGKIILAPPSALHDRWSRRFPEPVTALASGWMAVRQRAKQKRIELPLVISDHADWDELIATLVDVDAPEVWVTHGREDALIHYTTTTLGKLARPLELAGYEDEDD